MLSENRSLLTKELAKPLGSWPSKDVHGPSAKVLVMAHTKAAGSTKLGRDSESKRLGVKLSGGQKAIIGNIIIRQRGSKVMPGIGTKIGGDDTIYAMRNGVVAFSSKKKKLYNGRRRNIKIVSVV